MGSSGVYCTYNPILEDQLGNQMGNDMETRVDKSPPLLLHTTLTTTCISTMELWMEEILHHPMYLISQELQCNRDLNCFKISSTHS